MQLASHSLFTQALVYKRTKPGADHRESGEDFSLSAPPPPPPRAYREGEEGGGGGFQSPSRLRTPNLIVKGLMTSDPEVTTYSSGFPIEDGKLLITSRECRSPTENIRVNKVSGSHTHQTRNLESLKGFK